MNEILDGMSFVFWSIAYLQIIIYSLIYRKQYVSRMPVLVGAFSFAWEVASVFQGDTILLGHVMWLVLDAVILMINYCILWHHQKKYVLYYGIYTVICVIMAWYIFMIPIFDGMLYSSFILDALIAFAYVKNVKSIPREGKLTIALSRLCGDIPAYICYFSESFIVAIIGLISLSLTIYYILYCLEENQIYQKKKR